MDTVHFVVTSPHPFPLYVEIISVTYHDHYRFLKSPLLSTIFVRIQLCIVIPPPLFSQHQTITNFTLLPPTTPTIDHHHPLFYLQNSRAGRLLLLNSIANNFFFATYHILALILIRLVILPWIDPVSDNCIEPPHLNTI